MFRELGCKDFKSLMETIHIAYTLKFMKKKEFF